MRVIELWRSLRWVVLDQPVHPWGRGETGQLFQAYLNRTVRAVRCLNDRRVEAAAVPYVSLPECKSDEAGHVGGEVDELRVPTPSFPPPSSSSSLFPPPCSQAFAFVLEFSITHKQAHTTSLCVCLCVSVNQTKFLLHCSTKNARE